MDEASLESLLLKLAEIVYSMDNEIGDMRISIGALKATVASQINPGDPAKALEQIHQLDAVGREADPNTAKMKELGDVIDAIKLMRKHGSHET